MIIDADSLDVDDAIIELVNDFAAALIEHDKQAMAEVIFLVELRLSDTCRCYEQICICERAG